MQELLEAGSHFGHKVSRGNPRMAKYVFGARDGVSIIDLAQTESLLKIAAEKAYEVGAQGKVMLVIGTKKQSQDLVKKLATEAETPYLNKTWVPGLFTNFEEIKKNIKKLTELKEAQEKNQLSHYTKKERLLISRKLQKFESELGGISSMQKLPEAVFIVDSVSDNTAIKECLKLGVKVFGICDSNADPYWFDYGVPGNDDGIKSITIITETVIRSYAEGKKQAVKVASDLKEAEDKAKEAADKVIKVETTAEEKLDEAVAEEAAAIEEEIEKVVLHESERKVE